jgi:tetratricopeptide (TPR) repeat protein
MNDYAIGRMREYAAGIQSDELRLVDEAAPARSPTAHVERVDAPATDKDAIPPEKRGPRAAGSFAPPSGSTDRREAAVAAKSVPDASTASSDDDPAETAPAATDKFLLAAAKEYDAGIVDQPLWKRAVVQAGDDRTLATQTYLRARATALRVQKREKRQERSARRTRAMNELGSPGDAVAAPRDTPAQRGGALRSGARPARGRHVVWIGGAIASLFALAMFVTVRSESGAAAQQQVAAKPLPTVRVAAKTSGSSGMPAEVKPARDIALDDLIGKIETLKGAGNWNVVVVYAGEWIRKEPDNPRAWQEVSNGYVHLGQYRDALDAATRLVQLMPEDAAAWQNLGQIHVALKQPVDALAAFEQAVARNERDGESIVQMGLANTQLGRFDDARLAFARAFALNPQDVDALCGAASLAQREGRAKDAEAFMRQVASLDRRCRDANPGQTVRVAVGNNRPAVPAGR